MRAVVRSTLRAVGAVLVGTSVLGAQSPAPARKAAPAAPAAARGGIEGDAYLVMQSGDTKRGAGRAIRLLRDSPQLQSDLADVCAALELRVAAIRDSMAGPTAATKDSSEAAYRRSLADVLNESKRQAWRTLSDRHIKMLETSTVLVAGARAQATAQIDRLIVQSTADTTGTGMNAHYTFTRVAPGNYILFGDWRIGDNDYQWWAPVTAVAGRTVRRDLDNSVEADDKLYCGVR